MLGENIQRLRKQKGITQEELAIRLHVVRQTVSKWEKGLSVPDAEMLQRLSEALDAPVTELLGAKLPEGTERNELAEQLARINEQLAVKNRRARRIWTVVAVVLALSLLWTVTSVVLFIAGPRRAMATGISLSDDPVYTAAEVEDAFQVVTKHFKRHFRGCTLQMLYYNEETSAAESGAWAEQYNSDEAIVILSSFTTDKRGGDGSLNPNSTYTDWQWVLTRDDRGPWVLRTWGYG